MTTRQLEVTAYALLALGLVGTWIFVHTGLSSGGATLGGQIGLYTMTSVAYVLAAAGTWWMRSHRLATIGLLALWTAGIGLTFTVLFGTRGELLGELTVFMLPVLQVPVVLVAIGLAWVLRRAHPARAGDS